MSPTGTRFPVPSPRNSINAPSSSPTIRSGIPSPLKSPAAIDRGAWPSARWETIGLNEPSVWPSDTVRMPGPEGFPSGDAASAISTMPSRLKSPTAISGDAAPGASSSAPAAHAWAVSAENEANAKIAARSVVGSEVGSDVVRLDLRTVHIIENPSHERLTPAQGVAPSLPYL